MGLYLEGVHFGNISTEPILILPYDETRRTGAFSRWCQNLGLFSLLLHEPSPDCTINIKFLKCWSLQNTVPNIEVLFTSQRLPQNDFSADNLHYEQKTYQP